MSSAIVRWPVPGSQLAQDIDSAIAWLVQGALDVTKLAMAHERLSAQYIDQLMLLTACVELPGDMPLRVRCTPNVFNWRA